MAPVPKGEGDLQRKQLTPARFRGDTAMLTDNVQPSEVPQET